MSALSTEGEDIKSWLKSKDLEHLIPKFTESQLKLEHIFDCFEGDIRDLCKDYSWSTATRIKLISALKSTPGSGVNLTHNKPQIVFLGVEQKEILDKLYQKTEQISEDINQIQTAINGLERSAVECNKEIHSKCDILVSIIDKKRKLLLNTVNELKHKRRSELETSLQKLQEMSQTTMKSKNECTNIATKPDISSTLRLQQMSATVDKQNETEQKMDFDFNKINKSNIQLVVEYDEKAFNNNFDAALKVKFNDEQFELKYQKDMVIEILKFSTTYKSDDGLQLSDDNRCVTRTGCGHRYILAHLNPVRNGIHCWRIQTKNAADAQNWIMWGVSRKKQFTCYSYDDKEARGVAPANGSWYADNHNNPTVTSFKVKEREVDMLLNVDEGKLDLCVVGYNNDEHRIKIWNLQIGQYGWVPHFNLHAINTQLRIAKIPPSLFGTAKKNIF